MLRLGRTQLGRSRSLATHARLSNVLSAIADQHQPFYTYSNSGRTDRVFGYNKGVLALPKKVRAILCQDFVEVDLKSAHLLIAAWLWGADEALENLSDEDFSIWDDLMRHYRPLFEENGYDVPEKGDDLYGAVKAALKVAVYSTVYGMHEIAIKGQVTKSLGDILGDEAGKHLDDHPIIAQLLERRDEKLREMGVGDVLYGPTGIRIEVEKGLGEEGEGVGPKSAMATLAQSYEQAAMQVILELERDREQSGSRNYFRTALWLHDGAFVDLRHKRARVRDLNERLEKRCKELSEHAGKDKPMPAFFETEPIEPPQISELVEENSSSESEVDEKGSASSIRRSDRSPAPGKVSAGQPPEEGSTETSKPPASTDSERPGSCGSVGKSEQAVQRYLERMRRVSEGDVPLRLKDALDEGFSKRQWSAVHGLHARPNSSSAN